MVRRLLPAARRFRQSQESLWLIGLGMLSVAFMLGAVALPEQWPFTAFVVPVVWAMTILSIRTLLVLYAVVAACTTVALAGLGSVTVVRMSSLLVIVVVAVLVLVPVGRGQRLGVTATRGESMLVDLRDRLTAQSALPRLPAGWHAEAVMRSAGGASFSGDFIVSAMTGRGQRLEVVVVDVSGKGVGAGTRSLQLSGAFGGLLGSLPEEDFLPAANAYLLRQEWAEGFATAAHLAVDLETGHFAVRTAGHPPAVQFNASAGRWAVHWTDGPVLGLIDDASYSVHRGKLSSGDVLLVYTDGLVETPRRDIAYGIDKLVGEAERLVKHDFADGAARLVSSVDSTSDDRALLMLHRR